MLGFQSKLPHFIDDIHKLNLLYSEIRRKLKREALSIQTVSDKWFSSWRRERWCFPSQGQYTNDDGDYVDDIGIYIWDKNVIDQQIKFFWQLIQEIWLKINISKRDSMIWISNEDAKKWLIYLTSLYQWMEEQLMEVDSKKTNNSKI